MTISPAAFSANVKSYVQQYLSKYPNASSEAAGVAAHDYFQDLGIFSKKQLAQVKPLATEHFNQLLKLNAQKIETPKVQKANEKLNSAQAQKIYGIKDVVHDENLNYYYDFHQLPENEKMDRRLRKQEDFLVAVEDAKVERKKAIKRAEKQERRSKRIIKDKNLNYYIADIEKHNVMTKKTKRKAWHDANALWKSLLKNDEDLEILKRVNPRQYEKELAWRSMTPEARMAYKNADAISDAFASSEPWRNIPISSKNAEESMKIFEEAGVFNEKPSSKSVQSAVENVVENGKKAVEETVEKAGKGKWGWIAAGIGLVAAAFGGKAYMDKKAEQQLDVAA